MGVERDAAWYDSSYRTWEWRDKPADATPWTPLWRAILTFIRPEDDVLDLGCGAGHLAELRQARDGKSSGYWTGIDFARDALEAALRRVPVAVWAEGDVRSAPAAFLETADVVVLSEVLEHIEHDLAVLIQIPSGTRVVFWVPNFDSDGHVRHFASREEVSGRYLPLLRWDAECLQVASSNPERWWYVVAGVRA